jgi:hypothetical protein
MAAFSVAASTVATNGLVLWTKDLGADDITVSAGTITLPRGYIWTIFTQIALTQVTTRSFILWNGSAEYSNARRIELATTNSGNQMVVNVLDTSSQARTIAWRNTGASYALTAPLNGLIVVGVLA